MPYDPNLTADKAKSSVDQRLSIARGRRMPQTLGLIQEAADRNTYHVFNVGPWPHVINAGSIGSYVVPPCPPDKPYVECRRIIKGIETEYVPKDEFEYNPLMTDGWHIACELVGDGRGRAPAQSLRHYGLFPSRTEIPSQADIIAAKKMLHARCEDIVREARDLHAMDRKLFAQIVNRNRHWKAAEVLNLDPSTEDWMSGQVATKRTSCVFCGAKNDDMAVKCSNCHEIINVSRYRELKAEQEMAMAGPAVPERKKPGPKPRNPIQPEEMIGND